MSAPDVVDRPRPPRHGHERAAAGAARRDRARASAPAAASATSRRAHARPARAGASPSRRSLVLDVDTAEDLAALRAALDARTGGAAHTRGLLARARRVDERACRRGALGRACPRCAPATTSRALLARRRRELRAGDVLVVAHKVVSKAEGARARARRRRRRASARARWPREHGKDPRHVQVVLDESAEVVRAERGVLICRTHHGFVCANAGVDASNAPDDGALVLLPARPRRERPRAARRAAAAAPAVVIADSFGRAWRHGQCDVAIGVAGPARRSTTGAGAATRAGASCARLRSPSPTRPRPRPTSSRDKDSREPAVVVRGLERHVTDDDGPGAGAVRPLAEDLFIDRPSVSPPGWLSRSTPTTSGSGPTPSRGGRPTFGAPGLRSPGARRAGGARRAASGPRSRRPAGCP